MDSDITRYESIPQGLKPPFVAELERAKPEGLAYLEARPGGSIERCDSCRKKLAFRRGLVRFDPGSKTGRPFVKVTVEIVAEGSLFRYG
jgi:hypothetical protein